ncbi:MAG: hypothetical protein ABJB69_09100 [Spartobacteria bacterium]
MASTDNMLKGKIIVGLIAGGLFAQVAQATDPVGDFFKRVGNSFKNAGKQPAPRRTTSKTGGKRAGEKGAPNASPSPGAEILAGAPTPSATPVPTPSARRASAVTATKDAKRDAPYGIPVPGKDGFVTSPFAPDAGMVDVRDFPKGTEVKDPYTGKIFLRP